MRQFVTRMFGVLLCIVLVKITGAAGKAVSLEIEAVCL
jgi:hypothetical protein